jgi:hypothetical protein
MERLVKTTYFDHRKNPLRTNSGVHIWSAVPRALLHMQMDAYGARVCEVVKNDVLYAVVLRKMNNEIVILYKKDLADKAYRA